MQKTLLAQIVCGVVVVPAWFSFGQAVSPPAVSPAPAAQPIAPPVMDQKISSIPLRALPEVQDVRQRNTPWQQAADQAVAKIGEPGLKNSVQQQLSRVAPQVAKALLTRPGDSAMVTVAVYRQRDTVRDAAAAVAFEGLGDALNPSFFPRVLANFPKPPGVPNASAPQLELDSAATSYLCFFLDHGDLKAGNISHEAMKRSLDVAIEQARGQAADQSASAAQAALAQQQQDLAAQPPPAAAPVQPAPPPPDQSEAQPASANIAPDYAYPYWAGDTSSPYYGYDGWNPWFTYLPYGGQPIIVQPDYRHPHHLAGTIGGEGADLRREQPAIRPSVELNHDVTPNPTAPLDHSVNQTGPVPRPQVPPREPGTVGRPADESRAPAEVREPAREEPARAEAAPAAHGEAEPAAHAPAPAAAAEHGGGAPAPAGRK